MAAKVEEKSIANMEHVLETCRSQNSDNRENDNATNTTDTRSTNTQETEPTQHTQREVTYDNATQLFKNIEKGEWEIAHNLCREESPQLKIWVRNHGSEGTTFEWAVWKRLPLHEACRRQAPVWLVSAMLNAYPEAAYMKTHFGQLPIHVAVECGASPEVVNLIVLANWEGLLQSDNSGRTPLEILVNGKDSSPLEQYDQKVVEASLERSIKTLTSIHNKCDERIKEQSDAHEHEVKKLREKHKREILMEKDRQASLQSSLETIEELVEHLKAEVVKMQEENATHAAKEHEYMERIKKYQKSLQLSHKENAAHLEHVAALKDLITTKDAAIAKLERRIKSLQNDLISITLGHDDKLVAQYGQVEADLRTMLEAQVKLKSRLAGHSKALHSLLKERGIAMPQPVQDEKEKVVDKSKDNWDETPPVADEAANAAAASALAALKLADEKKDSV